MGDFFSFSLIVPFLLFFVFSQLFFVGYSSRFLVPISKGLFFIFKIEPITILPWSCIGGPYSRKLTLLRLYYKLSLLYRCRQNLCSTMRKIRFCLPLYYKDPSHCFLYQLCFCCRQNTIHSKFTNYTRIMHGSILPVTTPLDTSPGLCSFPLTWWSIVYR